MPDARRLGRLFASPGEPDGRQLPVYSVLAIVDLTSLTEATTGVEHSPTSATGTPRRRDATRDVGGAKTGDHEGEIY